MSANPNQVFKGKLRRGWCALASCSIGGAVLAACCWIVLDSALCSIDVPTTHVDGAFQTASGLFRLGSGQFPGRDFFPYLGVGPLFVILPVFAVTGGTLCASVFAAKFATLVLGWANIAILWHLILRPTNAIRSLAGGALILLGSKVIGHPSGFVNAIGFGLETGNSLRPIRASIPYIVCALSCLVIKRVRRGLQRDVLIGLVLGAGMLWSNDFAIPTALTFATSYCVLLWTESRSASSISVLRTGVSSVACWYGLLSLATLGHATELLRYNFLDVVGDQWWYFGPYGQKTRIFEIGQLTRVLSDENWFSLIVLGITIFCAVATRVAEAFWVSLIGVALFAGGCLASVGGHLGGYFEAFAFWGKATALLLVIGGIRFACLSRFSLLRPEILRIDAVLATAVCVLVAWGTGARAIRLREVSSGAKLDPERFFVPELGGYLGVEWRDYVAYIRDRKDLKVIEEYWGIWSAFNRCFSKWPVDSVIHALGGVRVSAGTALADADIIVSTRYRASPQWQPWNLSQNFWFYEDLLKEWVPDFVSPSTIVWRKTGSVRREDDVACVIDEDGTGFELCTDDEGFYKVTLSYSCAGAGRFLLLAQNNISFGTDAYGRVSLPPRAECTVTYPVLFTREFGRALKIEVVGSQRVRFKIVACSARRINMVDEDVLRTRTEEDFYLSDENWIHGIRRHHAGFFVPNRKPFTAMYQIGTIVRLSDSDRRRIIGIHSDGPYLNVDLEGETLDPLAVGSPSGFRVEELHR